MKEISITYKKAGVDIAKADEFVKRIKKFAKSTETPQFKTNLDTFGSAFDFFKLKSKKPVLVSSTDGVGTKLKIAFMLNKHDTVGIDLVAMNVNDILAAGARPLFFLDYIAANSLDVKVLSDVVKGIARGCKEAGCSLIGGELAELPGFYKKGEYDLAGFCTGVVEKDEMVLKDYVEKGDAAVGLASSGLHSNGFSLVRKVLSLKEQKELSSELLKPTKIYVKPVISLLEKFNNSSEKVIKAMAHVTGGAFYQKVVKIIPSGKCIKINKNSWVVPEIFKLIKKKGGIEEKEMFTTFNMGIGFVLVVKKEEAENIINYLKNFKLQSWVIGEIIDGRERIVFL